jgi:hypothetical protein
LPLDRGAGRRQAGGGMGRRRGGRGAGGGGAGLVGCALLAAALVASMLVIQGAGGTYYVRAASGVGPVEFGGFFFPVGSFIRITRAWALV